MTLLQPEPPLSFDKIEAIAKGAIGAAFEDEATLLVMITLIQFIPFVNLQALGQFETLVREVNPNHEISRVVTRTLVKRLVADVIDERFARTYQTKRISEADVRELYKAGIVGTDFYFDRMLAQGYDDKSIIALWRHDSKLVKDKLVSKKQLTQAEWSTAYEEGIVEYKEYVQRLQSLGLEPRSIEVAVSIADRKKEGIKAKADKEEAKTRAKKVKEALDVTPSGIQTDALDDWKASTKNASTEFNRDPSKVIIRPPRSVLTVETEGKERFAGELTDFAELAKLKKEGPFPLPFGVPLADSEGIRLLASAFAGLRLPAPAPEEKKKEEITPEKKEKEIGPSEEEKKKEEMKKEIKPGNGGGGLDGGGDKLPPPKKPRPGDRVTVS